MSVNYSKKEQREIFENLRKKQQRLTMLKKEKQELEEHLAQLKSNKTKPAVSFLKSSRKRNHTPVKAKKYCAECGEALLSDAAFCHRCGKKAPDPTPKKEVVCAECGRVMSSSMEFCPGCGTKTQKASEETDAMLPESSV